MSTLKNLRMTPLVRQTSALTDCSKQRTNCQDTCPFIVLSNVEDTDVTPFRDPAAKRVYLAHPAFDGVTLRSSTKQILNLTSRILERAR
jgi:hypothetical protein